MPNKKKKKKFWQVYKQQSPSPVQDLFIIEVEIWQQLLYVFFKIQLALGCTSLFFLTCKYFM